MTPEQKAWMDNASYEALLRKWRFSPIGDPMFKGETGVYFQKVLSEKRPSPEEHVKASKAIGW